MKLHIGIGIRVFLVSNSKKEQKNSCLAIEKRSLISTT